MSSLKVLGLAQERQYDSVGGILDPQTPEPHVLFPGPPHFNLPRRGCGKRQSQEPAVVPNLRKKKCKVTNSELYANVMCLDFVAFGGIFQIFTDKFYNFSCHSK